MTPSIHLHLMPRLRMTGDTPPLLLYSCLHEVKRDNLLYHLLVQWNKNIEAKRKEI
jgi:hypothetical protein